MSDPILGVVRDRYAAAGAGLSGDRAGVRAVAEAFGYTPEELDAAPAEANLGLSCGNPTAFAHLRPGETVVDLGCGGGLDVLLAAAKVGPAGKAVGIDMTPEMIERAKANAARRGAANVEFHLSMIDKLPLPDVSVDCLISNCVINLAPDKRAVFREMFRVLKPGGRVAVSDIALKRRLPAELARSVAAYVGCVAGAITFDEYRRGLEDAGFAAVQVIDSHKDLNVYALVEDQTWCCSPAMTANELSQAGACCAPGDATVHRGLAELLRRYDVNDYAASVQVYAVKAVARVLFVCVENSNRSQIAEAFARMHGGGRAEAYSAGSRPSGRVNPRAVEFMREVGYDLTVHQSKALADLPLGEFDVVVGMGCGDEGCSLVKAKRREEWGVPDPKEMPAEQYRTVRDLIEAKVKALVEAI